QPEPGLRPPGDALHEGISGHRHDTGQSDDRSREIELEDDEEANQAKRNDEEPGGFERYAATGERPQASSFYLLVEIAVDDVVVDAARASHGEGAKREPQEQVPAPADAGKGNAPRTGPVKQPRSDRPVQPHQRCEWPQPWRKRADEPAPLAVRNDVGGGGHSE